jgi:hypothetical protein
MIGVSFSPLFSWRGFGFLWLFFKGFHAFRGFYGFLEKLNALLDSLLISLGGGL